MEYKVTEEQKMIAESVDRLLAGDYDFQKRCKDIEEKQYFNQEIWNQLAGLGLLAMPFSQEYGGFNASIADMNVVMASLGRGWSLSLLLHVGSIYRHASDAIADMVTENI